MTIRGPHLSGRRPRISQIPQVQPDLLPLIVPPVFPTFLTPPPYWRTRRVQPPFQLGLQLTLMAPGGDKPFAQSDLTSSDPVAIQTPLQVGGFIGLFEDIGDRPAWKHEWPNPLAYRVIQQTLQQGLNFAYLASTGDLPGRQRDWPNPYIAPLVQPPRQGNIPISVLSDAGERPFFQSEWITPPARYIRQLTVDQWPLETRPLGNLLLHGKLTGGTNFNGGFL